MQVPLACSSEEDRPAPPAACTPRQGHLHGTIGGMEPLESRSAALSTRFRSGSRRHTTVRRRRRLFKRFVDKRHVADSHAVPGAGPRTCIFRAMGSSSRSRYGLASKMRRPSRPFTPENSARSEAYFRRELQIVGAMYRAGVGILAGTDLPVGHAIPGYGLHEELSLMVESRPVTVGRACRLRRLNPAKFFGLTDSLGRWNKARWRISSYWAPIPSRTSEIPIVSML